MINRRIYNSTKHFILILQLKWQDVEPRWKFLLPTLKFPTSPHMLVVAPLHFILFFSLNFSIHINFMLIIIIFPDFVLYFLFISYIYMLHMKIICTQYIFFFNQNLVPENLKELLSTYIPLKYMLLENITKLFFSYFYLYFRLFWLMK